MGTEENVEGSVGRLASINLDASNQSARSTGRRRGGYPNPGRHRPRPLLLSRAGPGLDPVSAPGDVLLIP